MTGVRAFVARRRRCNGYVFGENAGWATDQGEPMADEQTGADAEQVIPPPPPDTTAAALPFPPVVPLAPSLNGTPPGAPAGGRLEAPAGPPPPYATGIHPVAATSPTAPTAPDIGYPTAASPPPSSGLSNRVGVALAVVGGLVIFAVIGIAVLVGLLLGSPDTTSAPSAPTPSAFAEDPDGPSDEPPSDGDDPSAGDAAGIADRLDAKIDEYRRLRDSGALWQTIPDNEYNRTAVTAFLYLMTDMKVATIWGIDEQQAQEYDERMTMLEERLLAQEPLGDDIKITLEDRVFTYNGETGEGGYTDK